MGGKARSGKILGTQIGNPWRQGFVVAPEKIITHRVSAGSQSPHFYLCIHYCSSLDWCWFVRAKHGAWRLVGVGKHVLSKWRNAGPSVSREKKTLLRPSRNYICQRWSVSHDVLQSMLTSRNYYYQKKDYRVQKSRTGFKGGAWPELVGLLGMGFGGGELGKHHLAHKLDVRLTHTY